MYWSATYDFLFMFHSNHGPISYRFRDKRRLLSKIAQFSHPMYFAPPLTGFPLELGIGTWVKKLEWWGYQPNKKFDDIFSRLDTIHQRDRRTDTRRQQRLRSCIASHGKNWPADSYSFNLTPPLHIVQKSHLPSVTEPFLQCFDAVGWVTGRASGL